MDRRTFVTLAGSALVGAPAALLPGAAPAAAPPRRPRALMHVGCQNHPLTDEYLRYYQRCGVRNVVSSYYPAKPEDWTVENVLALRRRAEAFDVSVDMLALPYPQYVMLGKSPERDEEIDRLRHLIRLAHRAGIPALKYNLYLIPFMRTAPTPGRGGARYDTFILDQAQPPPLRPDPGRVTAEMMWERITYFLERVLPTAERYHVRLACHPHDPPTPPGFQGVDDVLGSVEGLQRFVHTCESEYHGLNFCQGTVAEMLEKPGRDIYDVIRWFGSRNKIFLVHFRNIRGGRDHFQEVYPDEGDVDMARAMRAYRDIAYSGMIIPDHVPSSPEDPRHDVGYAFAYGYIKGLIQAVNRE